MSNSTDCLSTFPSTTPTFLTPILSCQSQTTSSSPFCWPPNNTRICIPLSSRIPVFWPPAYYPPNSLVSIAFDTSSSILPGEDNVGNQTVDIGKSVWDQGVSVDAPASGDGAGKQERRVRMYMRTRTLGSNSITNHEGPTLILVKISEFPSPSPSARPKYDDDGDGIDALTGLSEGGMAGVIVGIVAGIIALVTGCCCLGWCACCGVKRGGSRRGGVVGEENGVGKVERRVMVGSGVELEMKNVGEHGVNGGAPGFRTMDPRVVGDEVGIVGGRGDEIQRGGAREVEEPPPKYTP